MMIINIVNDIAANGAIYKVRLLETFINLKPIPKYLKPLMLLLNPLNLNSLCLILKICLIVLQSTPKSYTQLSGPH